MNFLDLCDLQNNHLGDIIIFEDNSCVLKFNIFKKIYCFDNFEKLQKHLKAHRLDCKIIENGVFEEDRLIYV